MEINLDSEVDTDSQFCVKWSNHHGTLISVLETLFNDEMYVDCTLAAEGQEISAHKVVLSACSPFLNKLLKKHYDKHPIILLRDVSFFELQCVIEYMYKGEVNITHDQLSSFLKAAETLQIAGLSGVYEKNKQDSKCSNYSKDIERVDDCDMTAGEPDCMPHKRLKCDSEEVDYIAQEDSNEVDQIKIKNEYGNYQVYLVDNETGTLKEMDMSNDLSNEKVTAEVIDEIFNEEAIQESAHELNDHGGNKIFKEKHLPDKMAAVFGKSRIKPRSVIHREDYNFSCTKCGGLYKHESSFLNHLRHDCNQIHTCENCHKSFKNKRHLLDHVRDDCGRVHICPRCINLTTHMKHYCRPEKVQNAQTFVASDETL
ncbi:zinc finger protein, putative [Pediculus humanus corporis]|uniref:Zinc finger protein, putative n=1 Tax=Pediculus humanus subsp. corporis TaxID=121224 RepID=E0VVT1_PEDHC|nr:zinc finger protein, putative [Pediculus humanus corporis]EEB17487.1 zinc finger protein, putative [Pediculus humanus corporis]